MARRTFSYPLSLAVVVALLIMLTGGFIAWWNYRTGVQNVRQLASRMFDQITRETIVQTEAFLKDAPPVATMLADLQRREPVTGDAALERCIIALKANPTFKWVTYSEPDGRFVGAYRVAVAEIKPVEVAPDTERDHSPPNDTGVEDPPPPYEMLSSEEERETPDVIRTNRSYITAEGKTVVEEHEFQPDGTLKLIKHDDDGKYDPRTRPFYKLAAQYTEGWTPPYLFNENAPGVTYAIAVKKGKDLTGVFTIDFHLTRLSQLAKELKFSMHGRVAIVGGDSQLLGHTTHPVVREGQLGPELVEIRHMNDPVAKEIYGTKREVEVGGETYLVRQEDLRGVPWWVMVYAPESDFTAAMRGRVITSLIISLLAVGIAVLVAWRVARRVSGPLIALSEEMVKVGGLHLDDKPVGAASMFREIDMMNTSLEKMKGGLRSFSRYVPRDLVRTLLSSGHTADLSGEVRELTIYFSDLAGFTSLSETRAPDELVQFLSEYFDDMSRIIMGEQGTVDKYMGDGIMAFWGAPLDVKDHASRACAAALRCQKRVAELSAKGVSLATRIGPATGKVPVGNPGPTGRPPPTRVGAPAHPPRPPQGLNKQYGTELMISAETYAVAKDDVVARPIDVVAVKGKRQGVRVFELLAMKSENDESAEAVAAASTRALDAYLARDFAAAAAAWNEVLAKRADDKAATIMRDRSLAYAATPPPDDWSGVMVATEK